MLLAHDISLQVGLNSLKTSKRSKQSSREWRFEGEGACVEAFEILSIELSSTQLKSPINNKMSSGTKISIKELFSALKKSCCSP